ncbi:carboxylate-amine ligase [Aeromicrobium duanguangcaii]|uniref:Putative glutamate--cysteine ligase 2 n=1 Tax=Aeromicrobium duanguangcaii TaxID=2968086 RepID=A0ABY5KFK5_9ACTN|nr:glutamate--cysteine ligase [Aeromicrobium duanguangcaii]MCD9154809.1 glutamate--cysteine ligase [Aeromicrobium duanguangcaii]UUI67776.1 glutamate--cysteine ligase [Aeromicrobium duanguangcaii]
MHTVGIEEELFVVDDEGRLVAGSEAVLRAHRRLEPGDELDHELFLQQVEIQTDAHADPDALHDDLLAQRSSAVSAARAAGLHLAAVPVDVLGGTEPAPTPKSRYEEMISRYGEIARNGMTCGMHIHVQVPDEDAVRVIDSLRPWTPILTALSANAPFFNGRDTSHASWRGHLWDTWPTAGPVEAFGDHATYRAMVDGWIASGAALDEHMVYLDARPAESYPTVEVRVADVCTEVDDALLVAEVTRGLVATILSGGLDTGSWRLETLKAARWRARHDGLEGALLDPTTGTFVAAEQALESLLKATHQGLAETGTTERVTDGVHRLLTSGNGAVRQRAVAGADLDLAAVMADLIHRTNPKHD